MSREIKKIMAGGGAPAPKQDEPQPHPPKDQLPNISYCITSPPPWPEAILLGFQHYLVMLGTTVLIPNALVPQMGGGYEEKAKVVQTILFVVGINTLLQTMFGTRLPAVIGASYTFEFLRGSFFIQNITEQNDDTYVDFYLTLSEEILEEFFNLRLEYYEKRKKVMLENLELELLKLENKVKFILGVVSGEIIVNNRKKAELVQELRERGFTPFPKKSKPVEAAVSGVIDATEDSEENSEDAAAAAPSYTFVHDSDYDYLLSLAIATLTLEKVQELCAERDKMVEEVEDLRKATPRSLWLKDLNSLDAELDVWNLQRSLENWCSFLKE